jgi:RNA polymerase sporulation-specific sigma factor
MLEKAIKTLGDREREILVMRYFHGKTQIEVSNEVGISQAQVSRLEKNALDGIRKRI